MASAPGPGTPARRASSGGFDLSTSDLARAARLLVLRSRREASGLFAGNYASAFRGGGLEFEESRPYLAGDDVRTIDWNATARHGETFVKRFREERDQTLLFALDVSASMAFAAAGRSKAGVAAHAIALMSAAAGRAGDRIGLVPFAGSVREVVPVARGVAHGWHVVSTAVASAATPGGVTSLAAALRALRVHTRRRAVVPILSDFRDPALLPGSGSLRDAFADLTRRHDVVAGIVLDPLELELPSVGPVRLADPERPGATWVLDTSSRRARRRYLAACAERRRALARELRRAGADLLWLRADQNPLYALGRFFHERAGRRRRSAA